MTNEAEATQSAAVESTQEQVTQEAQDPGKQTEAQNRDAIVARIVAERAAKATQAAAPAEAQASETAPVEGQAKAEGEKPAGAKPEPAEQEVDPVAEALNQLATKGRALAIRDRQLREREAALQAKEKQPAAPVVPPVDLEYAAKIRAAKASGDPIELLRATGFTDAEIRSGFALKMLERLAAIEAGGEAKPEPEQPRLTVEQIIEQIEARRKTEEGKKQEAAARQAAEVESKAKDAFFSTVAQEFKTNQYPLTAAIKPTMGEMDAHFLAHYQATGERLSPQQLLAAFEARYKAAGVVVAPKATTKVKAPIPVVTSRATSSAGETVVTEARPGKRSLEEIEEEGKRQAMNWLSQKRSARSAAARR